MDLLQLMLLTVVAGAAVPRAGMYWNSAANCMFEGRNRSDVQVCMQKLCHKSVSFLLLYICMYVFIYLHQFVVVSAYLEVIHVVVSAFCLQYLS